jgi:hypothetical protein
MMGRWEEAMMYVRYSQLVSALLFSSLGALACAGCGEPKADDTGQDPDDTGQTTDDTAPPDTPPEPLEGTLALTDADVVIQDASGTVELGSGVASAGDVNGDGQDDLLVASYTCDGGLSTSWFPGCVHLFLGPVDSDRGPADAIATLQGPSDIAWAGYTMGAAGDVNGDGFGDLLIGGPGNHKGQDDPQAAWLLHGPIEASLSLDEADLILLPALDGDASGHVATGGDIDGDGMPDLAVGAPQDDQLDREAGAVYLLSATLEGTVSLADASVTILSDSRTGHAGDAVSFLGDVDGDGVEDLAFGVPQEGWAGQPGDDVPGAAYLFHGPLAGSYELDDADTRIAGEGLDAKVGRGVCGVGDTDGDGLAELAVGAELYSGSVEWSGAVAVFRDVTGDTVQITDAELIIEGHEPRAWIGRYLANVDDVDGDGRPDLLIGSMFSNEPVDYGGRAFLFTDLQSGVLDTSTATATFEAHESHLYLGAAISGAGDQNGDGTPDLIMGTRDYENEGRNPGAYLFFGG